MQFGTIDTTDILPIIVADFSTRPPTSVSFQGTGFLVSPHLFITCWHCIRAELPSDQAYGVLVERPEVGFFQLLNLERDNNGSDLATAQVDLVPKMRFPLSEEAELFGTDVFTVGFPLAEISHTESGEMQIHLSRRFLKGHITRTFFHSYGEFGSAHSYEVSFPAPEGLSGAPLMTYEPKIIGVMYRNYEAYTIAEEVKKDPRTGEIQPETRRIVSFGLALHNDILCQLTTTNTGGKPLIEFVRYR